MAGQHSSLLPWCVFQVMEQGTGVQLHVPHYSSSHIFNLLPCLILCCGHQLLKTSKGKHGIVQYSIIKVNSYRKLHSNPKNFVFCAFSSLSHIFRAEEQRLPTGWRVLRTRNTISQHLLLCKIVFLCEKGREFPGRCALAFIVHLWHS